MADMLTELNRHLPQGAPIQTREDRAVSKEVTCIDCGSADLAGPDFEGFYDCRACGAAWIPGHPDLTKPEDK